MRRDILELDEEIQRRLSAVELGLMQVEAMRLALSGGSVVDWQRLAFRDPAEVDRFLELQRLDLRDPVDRERLRYVFNEAVSYLEEKLAMRFPRDLRNPQDVRDVFLAASDPTGFRRRQVLCCVVLKLMHVIHHMEAADLKFKVPVAEAGLFDIAEGDILRRARAMRESGLPILSFYGSRKARSSVITKLISKKENLAATVFDKLRFRLIVDGPDALAPTLAWLTDHFFPFNYVIPGQSHNNLLSPDTILGYLPAGTELQELVDYPGLATSGKNEFSGANYRMINFIVDYPVRLPDELITGFGFELGRVVFVMVEFQIVDEATATLNEDGENAHTLYKARQLETVARRLVRGYDRDRAGRGAPDADTDNGTDDEPTEVLRRPSGLPR
jgi:uncharacterized protein (TIGR04552 family)